MLKRLLLFLGVLAGCRSIAAPPDTVASSPELARPAAATVQEPDPELAVEVVRLRRVSADEFACLICPEHARWNENRYCAMLSPWSGPVITPPDAAEWEQNISARAGVTPELPWSVDVLAAQNAIVIRGSPARVARIRDVALRIDRGG